MYPKKLALVMTRDCNMHCSYCYVRKSKGKIDFEEGKKVIAEFIDFPGPYKEIIFTGGEPLLTFSTVQRLILFSEECKKRANNEIRYSVLTNGIGLSKKHLDFFRNYNVKVQLSLDGNKTTQNISRKIQGKDSFDTLKNLFPILKRYDNISINAVFTPKTVKYLTENLKFFYKYFKKIRLSYAYDANWTMGDLKEFAKTFNDVAGWYLKIRRHNKQFIIENIESLISKDFVPKEQKKEGICDTICYSPEGLYFSCLLFLSLNKNELRKISFGSINEGLLLPKRAKMLTRWGFESKRLVRKMLGGKAQCNFCLIPFYIRYNKKEFLRKALVVRQFNKILFGITRKYFPKN